MDGFKKPQTIRSDRADALSCKCPLADKFGLIVHPTEVAQPKVVPHPRSRSGGSYALNRKATRVEESRQEDSYRTSEVSVDNANDKTNKSLVELV